MHLNMRYNQLDRESYGVKIMKKIACVLLFVVLIVYNLVGAACECKHYFEEISNVEAICEQKGKIILQCTKCSATIEKETNAIGHRYVTQSSTATCTESGIVTSKCANCNKEITEKVEALGHKYNSYGYCTNCRIFKYDIQISVTLPREFKYYYKATNHIYSKCLVTDVYFEIQESKLIIFFYGSKTYDEDGAYGNNKVDFVYVLKDSKGNILYSDNLFKFGLVVGQNFGTKGYIGKTTNVSEYSLSPSETYTLEIVDKGI